MGSKQDRIFRSVGQAVFYVPQKMKTAFHYISTLGKSALKKSMGPKATSSAGRGGELGDENPTLSPTTFGMLNTPALSATVSEFVVLMFSCCCGSVFVVIPRVSAIRDFSLM